MVMPLEFELRGVEGVEEITSYAQENFATVVVEFDVDFDLRRSIVRCTRSGRPGESGATEHG